MTSVPTGPTAREQLVAATRELMLAVAITDIADADLAGTAEQLRDLVPGLAARQVARVPAPSYQDAVGADSYHSAAYNPAMVPLRMAFSEGRAEARLELGSLHEGPRGSVHGGVISSLMDTLLASLVQQQGHLCVTASLTVDYRARTPLWAPLDLVAEITERRRRSLLVEGTIAHQGQVTVQAKGLFVAVLDR